MSAPEEAIARENAEASPMQRLMGYRLVAWEPDRAVLAYEIATDHINRTGRLHGGVYAVLLDTVAGFCGCYPADGERRACVTLSLTVNYVAAASQGRLTAEARRTGGGRSIFFAEAAVRDAEGRVLATAMGSFRYLSKAS